MLYLMTTALVAFALTAGAAQAKVAHVTGQKSTFTPSAQVTHFLATHHVTVSAVGPATISGTSVTLPITGGFITRKLNGVLRHRGGVKFATATRSFVLRRFLLVRKGHHASLFARVHHRRIRLARVTDLKVALSGKSATATGELKLTAAAARMINKLLGSKVVHAGADLGSVTSDVTTG
jgi:hypothetical protein